MIMSPISATCHIWSTRAYLHIAKVTTQFFITSLFTKPFHGPTVEPNLAHDTPTDAYSHRVVPFEG